MAKLVWIQLESCHANMDGTAWYAYYEGEPDGADFNKLEDQFEDGTLLDQAPLGWEIGDFEEVPNPLSKHTGLRRYCVAAAV